MINRILKSVLLTTFFAASSGAAAMTIDLDPQGRYVYPLAFVDLKGPVSGYAGVISVVLNGGVAAGAFCVDLYHDVSPGITYNVNILSPTDAQSIAYSLSIGRVAWLLVNQLPIVNAAPNANIQAAGLQLAIWDVIHDGGDHLTNGTVLQSATPDATSAAVYVYAEQFINASVNQSAAAGAAVLMNVNGPTGSQT